MYPRTSSSNLPGSASAFSLSQESSLVSAKKKLAGQFVGDIANKIYILPRGLYEDRQEKTPNLLAKVYEQLTKKEHGNSLQSLMLLGDSGMGKTSFCLYFYETIWQRIRKDPTLKLPLPIYIHLTKYREQLRACDNLLEYLLVDELKLLAHEYEEILKQPLLLIVDGFDEVLHGERANLYHKKWWSMDIRVLVASRPEALSTIQQRLVCHHTFRLQKFTSKQILEYLKAKQKIEKIDSLTNDCLQCMENLPSLKTLVRIPFLLTVFAQVLPMIIKLLPQAPDVEKNIFLRKQLFNHFFTHWFEAQAQRVIKQGYFAGENNSKRLYLPDIAGYMWNYSKNLAVSLLNDDEELDDISLDDKKSLQFELTEPAYNQELLALYHHDNPNERHSDFFFTSDGAGKKDCNELNIKAIRSGCPLLMRNGKFKFLHESLAEQLAMQELMEGLLGKYDCYLNMVLPKESIRTGKYHLKRKLITQEPKLIKKLMGVASHDKHFKKLLEDILMASKHTGGLHIAAANAITVLHYMDITRFENADLSDVQIPGANLRGGRLINTDFRGSNLHGVDFRYANLTGARWDGAEVGEIILGKKALRYSSLHKPFIANAYIFLGSHKMIGANDGYIYIVGRDRILGYYQHQSYTKHQSYAEDQPAGVMAITRAILPRHSNITATGGRAGLICLWDTYASKAKLILSLRPADVWIPLLKQRYEDISYLLMLIQQQKVSQNILSFKRKCSNILSLLGRPNARQLEYERIIVKYKYLLSMLKKLESKQKQCGAQLEQYESNTEITGIFFIGHFLISNDILGVTVWRVSSDALYHTRDHTRGAYTREAKAWPTGVYLYPYPDSNLVYQNKNSVNLAVVLTERGNHIFDSDFSYKYEEHYYSHYSCQQICLLASTKTDGTTFLWNPDSNFNKKTQLSNGLGFVQLQRSNCLNIPKKYVAPTTNIAFINNNVFGVTLLISNHAATLIVGIIEEVAYLLAIVPMQLRLKEIGFAVDRTLKIARSDFKSKTLKLCMEIKQNDDTVLSIRKDLTLSLREEEINRRSYYHDHYDKDTLWKSRTQEQLVENSWNWVDINRYGGSAITSKNWIFNSDTIVAILPNYALRTMGDQNLSRDDSITEQETCNKYQLPSIDSLIHESPNYFSCEYKRRLAHEYHNIVECLLNLRKNEILFYNMNLYLDGISINKVLHLSHENHALCQQFVCNGEPNINSNVQYQAWHSLFKPIIGTAYPGSQESLIGLDVNEQVQKTKGTISKETFSQEVWHLSIARKQKGSSVGFSNTDNIFSSLRIRSSTSHVFLIIEGVKQYRRFVIRAELVLDQNQAEVVIGALTKENKDKNYNFDEFEKVAKSYEATQCNITPEKAEKLLHNIRADQQCYIYYSHFGDGKVAYITRWAMNTNGLSINNLLHSLLPSLYYVDEDNSSEINDGKEENKIDNCLSWCRRHVNEIGISIPYQWYNFLVTLPSDVTNVDITKSESESESISDSLSFLSFWNRGDKQHNLSDSNKQKVAPQFDHTQDTFNQPTPPPRRCVGKKKPDSSIIPIVSATGFIANVGQHVKVADKDAVGIQNLGIVARDGVSQNQTTRKAYGEFLHITCGFMPSSRNEIVYTFDMRGLHQSLENNLQAQRNLKTATETAAKNNRGCTQSNGVYIEIALLEEHANILLTELARILGVVDVQLPALLNQSESNYQFAYG